MAITLREFGFAKWRYLTKVKAGKISRLRIAINPYPRLKFGRAQVQMNS